MPKKKKLNAKKRKKPKFLAVVVFEPKYGIENPQAILKLKFGSHLYGTDTPASDLDFKGIYLPTAREIVLGNYKKTIATSRPKADFERNNKDDVDLEVFSLDRYLELLMQGQTVALDMLFAPDSFVVEKSAQYHWVFRQILMNSHRLLTRNVNAFVGYARQQAAKYGIKGSRMDALKRTAQALQGFQEMGGESVYARLSHPAVYAQLAALVSETAELVSLEKTPLVEIVYLKGPTGDMDAPHLRVNGRCIPLHATIKYAREVVAKMLDSYGARAHKAHLAGGIDWKALSHAVRVNSEALELLTSGHITFPRPDRDLLIKIKTGKFPYEAVATLIEEGLAQLTEAHENSILRDEPDQAWADDFVAEVYTSIVKASS